MAVSTSTGRQADKSGLGSEGRGQIIFHYKGNRRVVRRTPKYGAVFQNDPRGCVRKMRFESLSLEMCLGDGFAKRRVCRLENAVHPGGQAFWHIPVPGV
ncbi:hypothetical protein AA0228_0401 [Gluconobacter frateurii NRIC 0228]|uniref:Uncharacterized protein n=1 Tax=Gluconobacter frateurii NRIC 0228 TaxID=1307946 RepID=A0ABQ0Q856_9PROT|nr:hypothetical protein AA0228_0401 [Gluconobacter frateurii NRIC 0228]